jgi:hypothetical protein
VSSDSEAVPRSTVASVNENRRFPPPWVVAGGVVAALVLLFLLGFAYGQRPDWHIGEWHWGNIFTVTVASLAIISSVVVSKITLTRNAAQFEESRIDARNDKLRATISDPPAPLPSLDLAPTYSRRASNNSPKATQRKILRPYKRLI